MTNPPKILLFHKGEGLAGRVPAALLWHILVWPRLVPSLFRGVEYPVYPTVKQEPLLPAVGRTCVRWIPSTPAISRTPAKNTFSKSPFSPLLLSADTLAFRHFGDTRQEFCAPVRPCGGECAASAACGSAPESFLTACSCQTLPVPLGLLIPVKSRQAKAAGAPGQHPWVSQTLTDP